MAGDWFLVLVLVTHWSVGLLVLVLRCSAGLFTLVLDPASLICQESQILNCGVNHLG